MALCVGFALLPLGVYVCGGAFYKLNENKNALRVARLRLGHKPACRLEEWLVKTEEFRDEEGSLGKFLTTKR